MAKRVINSFNAGELSPYLYARGDFEKYNSGCLKMENFIPLPYGGAVRRPPCEFLGEAMDTDADGASDAVRLIPFISSTANAYQIELGDGAIRFWKDGKRINETETSIVDSSAYKWTESGSGTDEYYLEALAGGDPFLLIPDELVSAEYTVDGTPLVRGTAGSLEENQWDYTDNDTLGYNTVYVRIIVQESEVVAGQYALVSSGTQYIDTGRPYTLGEGFRFKVSRHIDGVNVKFGGYIGAGDNFVPLYCDPPWYSASFVSSSSSGNYTGSPKIELDSWYEIKTEDFINQEYQSLTFTSDTTSFKYAAYLPTTGGNLLLFGVLNSINSTIETYPCKCSRYETTTDYEYGEHTLNMWAVPSGMTASGASASTTSDIGTTVINGVAPSNCMYDAVRDMYCENRGTGIFTIETL